MKSLRIIGQGLAGTVLAWRCLERRIPFQIVDRSEPTTASSIAAGLVTPISGQRLRLAPDHDALREEMEAFYRELPLLGHPPVYQRRPIIRILLSDRELQVWNKRLAQGDPVFAAQHTAAPELPHALNRGQAAFTMTHSGVLDIQRFLSASREHFDRAGALVQSSVEIDQVLADRQTQTALCTGPWLRTHPAFTGLPLHGSQGDTLTLHIPELDLVPPWIVNAGLWLMPSGNHRFRAGSTYMRTDTPRGEPSPIGRQQLECHLRRLLKVPFTVEAHQAAVRPVGKSRQVLLGRHPQYPQVAIFTGLASKGVLTAPRASRWLLDHLVDARPLPPENDVHSYL